MRCFLKLGRLFFGGKNDVFGLDIGSRWVKVVKLRQDERGYKVIGVAKQEIVQNVIMRHLRAKDIWVMKKLSGRTRGQNHVAQEIVMTKL